VPWPLRRRRRGTDRRAPRPERRRQPRRRRTDAERNCISNIRPDSFRPAAAADKLLFLIAEMRRLQLGGIALKDEQTVMLPQSVQPPDAALHD
jgi:hypothetical protein